MRESTSNLRVPGYEVVIVSPGGRGPSWGELRHPSREPLRGKRAFNTAMAVVGEDDPALLADLAIAFVDPRAAGKVAWRSGKGVLGDAQPAPPAIQGRTLRYWRAHARLAEMVLVSVDLDTADTTVRRARDVVQSGPSSAAELIARVEAVRESGQADPMRAAISDLTKLDDADARVFIAQFLAAERRPFLRKATVESIGRNGTTGGDAILATVLIEDADKEVRRAAARALENWRQPDAAREALQQASTNDSDPVVKAIAARALAKLP
ncbi:MAG: hypothetical protein EA397_19075 [Deltaproteobacteria bacterium]|nr:MAG: hypothetical protein EA397_19075 [Deltaproteobacteria bacterium]